MDDADSRLRAGDLDGARSALVENVRSNPSDPGARLFLFQLLALAGDWEKARNHLNTLAKLSPEAQMLSVVYNQALDAEAQRAEVFAGKAKVAVLRGAWAEGIATALQHYASGDIDAGDTARDEALEQAPDTPGEMDGARFDWIADSDSRFGPTFEAVMHGRYGLIAFSEVERIESEGPKDLRDLVWYPVQIHFKEGQSVAALLPARYPGTEISDDAAERMGRATSWKTNGAGEVGSGQHLLSLSSGEERGLLSLRSLTFD